MKNPLFRGTLLAVCAGSAVAATAFGTPRESTTFPTSIISSSTTAAGAFGQPPTAALTVLNQTFTGGYNAVRINFTGSLTSVGAGTWREDSRIYVTPPAGASYTVQPFTGATYTNLPIPDGFGVNLGAGMNPVGQWTYRFYEDYQDTAVGETDATWDNLVLTFDDAVPPPPPPPTPDLNLGNLAADGVLHTDTAPFTGATIRWIRFVVPAAGVSLANGTYLDIDTENSERVDATVYDTYMTLFNEDGSIRAQDDDDGSGFHSQLSFGIGTRAAQSTNGGAAGAAYDGRDGALNAGVYFLAVYGFPNAAAPAAPFTVSSGSAQDGTLVVNIVSGQQAPPAPPTVFFDMGTIPTTGAFVTHTFGLDPATVKWAKITVGDVNAANQTFLDLDTETSTALATAICMFRPDGTIAGQDTIDGSGTLSQLTFGAGTRAGVGNSSLYNGRDGATLAAGEYFVAVSLTPATFSTGWFAGSTSVDAGDLTLRVRAGTQPPPAPPATFTDLGTLAAGTINQTFDINAGDVKWYKLTVATDISAANNKYLDIDTEGSTINDTYMTMFDNTGAIRSQDDDSGSNFMSQFTYGQTFPARPAVGNGLAYDGADGTLVAGIYWLAVYGYPNSVGSPAAGWIVGSTSAQTGQVAVNLVLGTATLPPGTFVKTVDGGETVADAIVVGGTGTLSGIAGFLTANHADVYRIQICDFANFSATTVGGPAFDSQIFLFKSLGDGVTMTDDNTGGIAGPSTITSQFVTTNGTYYLAITGYNRDPVDADGNLLWNNEPFEGEHAPDGPGAANVLASWASTLVTPAAQPSYLITLTGACFVATGPTACNAADVAGLGGSVGPDHALTADDVVVYLGGFFSGDLAIADIAILGGAPGHDGQLTADDIVYFLSQFFSLCNP